MTVRDISMRKALLICLALLSPFILQLHVVAEIRLTKFIYERISKEYGKAAEKRVRDWGNKFIYLQDRNAEEKLYAINNFFNQIPYFSDQEHWGKSDYWATPIESKRSI